MPREQPDTRRRWPSVVLSLEEIEPRILPSASSLVLQAAADAIPQMTAALDQGMQLITMAEQDLSDAWSQIAQEVSYAVRQYQHLLGINTNSPNQSTSTPATQASSSTMTTHEAARTSPSIPKIKPQLSDGPNFVGVTGYLWDPASGSTSAQDGHNWDYNGMSQKNVAKPLRPGDTSDEVLFDPLTTQDPGLSGNGASAITWDYDPSGVISIVLGGQSAYIGKQTINSGITVDASVTTQVAESELYLNFTDGTSKFQIDGNSTITNMALDGATNGLFQINSGTTTIAGAPGFNESLQVQVKISYYATLLDGGWDSLLFTGNNVVINDQGTMSVFFGKPAGMTLLNGGGNTNDYINVNLGSLEYHGNASMTDKFTVPILVQNGGGFFLDNASNKGSGGRLVVQGTVPNQPNNASVYMRDPSSEIVMSRGVTLEADNDYYQFGGVLETTDSSMCTLQDGPAAQGTATIAGGSLAVDTNANDYGRLNLMGNLSMSALLQVAVQGYVPNNDAGTSDLLYVAGTLTLNKATSTIIVYTYGELVKTDYWKVIECAGGNIVGDFNSGSSVPAGQNMTYGPSNNPDPGFYRITFNG